MIKQETEFHGGRGTGGIFQTKIAIDKRAFQTYPDSYIRARILRKYVELMAQDNRVQELVTTETAKEMNRDDVVVRTRVAILPEDEYKRLKQIEKEYESYLESYR